MSRPRYSGGVELERTVETLVPRVLRYCMARTRSWELAEDVAQEALTAVVHRWRTTGPPDSPIAFALVVARRRLAARSVQAARTEPLDGLDGEIRDQAVDSERAAAAGLDLGRTLTAIAHLSPAEQEALRLVVLAQMSYAEAARMLGVGESALKMRVSRARQRLKEVLSNGHRS